MRTRPSPVLPQAPVRTRPSRCLRSLLDPPRMGRCQSCRPCGPHRARRASGRLRGRPGRGRFPVRGRCSRRPRGRRRCRCPCRRRFGPRGTVPVSLPPARCRGLRLRSAAGSLRRRRPRVGWRRRGGAATDARARGRLTGEWLPAWLDIGYTRNSAASRLARLSSTAQAYSTEAASRVPSPRGVLDNRRYVNLESSVARGLV